jgi:hypothetical protein
VVGLGRSTTILRTLADLFIYAYYFWVNLVAIVTFNLTPSQAWKWMQKMNADLEEVVVVVRSWLEVGNILQLSLYR